MPYYLELDASVYHLDAVQKAAYRFIDRLTVVLSKDDRKLICEFSPVKSDTNLEALLDDFKREILDQELRLKIRSETESVRNLILAYAFSRSGLQQ